MQIIRNGLLLGRGRADILIDGGRIADVLAPEATAPDGAATIDASDRLVIPGLVNAHTHAQTHLMKGIGDRWTLELLLNAQPWTAGKRPPELHRLSALLGAAEMALKGCTTAYDLFAEIPAPSPEGVGAVAGAYAEVGLRAVIAPMMADRTFYEAIPGLLDAFPPELRRKAEAIRATPYETSLAGCRAIYEGWSFDRDRVRPAIAPTIPHHCSDEFLRACRDLAEEFDIGVHMHVSESKVQAHVGLARYGTTLVGHLKEVGLLSPRFTAGHAIWLDDDDISRLADAGASVAHNPGSNMRLGSGLARVRKMLEKGIAVGIGTDGTTCSDNLNMFEAMRLSSFASRLQSVDWATWLSGAEALHAATEGGARALGMEKLIGRIEKGFCADLVFLDLSKLHYVPLNDPLTQLVFAEDGTAVDRVIVGGRIIVENGRLLTVDLPALRRRVEDAVAELRARATDMKGLSAALEPHLSRFCIGLATKPYHTNRLCDGA